MKRLTLLFLFCACGGGVDPAEDPQAGNARAAGLSPEYIDASRVSVLRGLPIDINVEWDLRQGHFTWRDGDVVRHDVYDPALLRPMDSYLEVLEWHADLFCNSLRNPTTFCTGQSTGTSTTTRLSVSTLCAPGPFLFPQGVFEEPFYCEVEFRAVCRDLSPMRQRSHVDCLWNVEPSSQDEAMQHGSVEFDFALDGSQQAVDGWVLRDQYPTPRARSSRAETTLHWVARVVEIE